MTGCTVEEEADVGRVVLRFDGDFDRESVLELRMQIAPLKGALLLDFSQVRDFDDLGVATLARVLCENQAGRFALRGLNHHQVRMFHYMGVEVEEGTGAAHPVQHH